MISIRSLKYKLNGPELILIIKNLNCFLAYNILSLQSQHKWVLNSWSISEWLILILLIIYKLDCSSKIIPIDADYCSVNFTPPSPEKGGFNFWKKFKINTPVPLILRKFYYNFCYPIKCWILFIAILKVLFVGTPNN